MTSVESWSNAENSDPEVTWAVIFILHNYLSQKHKNVSFCPHSLTKCLDLSIKIWVISSNFEVFICLLIHFLIWIQEPVKNMMREFPKLQHKKKWWCVLQLGLSQIKHHPSVLQWVPYLSPNYLLRFTTQTSFTWVDHGSPYFKWAKTHRMFSWLRPKTISLIQSSRMFMSWKQQ